MYNILTKLINNLIDTVLLCKFSSTMLRSALKFELDFLYTIIINVDIFPTKLFL